MTSVPLQFQNITSIFRALATFHNDFSALLKSKFTIIEWMMIWFKFQRLIEVNAVIDPSDIANILNVVNYPQRITAVFPDYNLTYTKQIARVRGLKDIKEYLDKSENE